MPHPLPLPFILSMGPQRSGTSWLDRYLRKRGDICLPSDVKEVFFFDLRYEDLEPDSYAKHFNPKSEHRLIMEISTTYFDEEKAPKRVFEYFGKDVKLLCPLRHPVLRSYSLYKHFCRYGIAQGTLQEACAAEPSILTSSHYAEHLQNWFKYFDREQIHIIFQEDLENDQPAFVRSVCDALEIPFIHVPNDLQTRYNATTEPTNFMIAKYVQKAANFLRSLRLYWVINFAKALGLKNLIFGKEPLHGGKKIEIPEEDEKWLNEQLGDEVKKLEDLIGPIPAWKNIS